MTAYIKHHVQSSLFLKYLVQFHPNNLLILEAVDFLYLPGYKISKLFLEEKQIVTHTEKERDVVHAAYQYTIGCIGHTTNVHSESLG